MAWYKEFSGPALEAYRGMIQEMKNRAINQLGVSDQEIVIRDMLVSDLLAGNASTTAFFTFGALRTGLSFLSGGVGANDVNAFPIANNKFIGIYGILNAAAGTALAVGQPAPGSTIATSGFGSYIQELLTPVVGVVKITRKGSVARLWNTFPLFYWRDHLGYNDEPVILDQNTTVSIEVLAAVASSSAVNFMPIGAVVEKRGLLINP